MKNLPNFAFRQYTEYDINMYEELRKTIEAAWQERALLTQAPVAAAIREVIELVDKGLLRTAEPVDPKRASGA